MSTTRNSLIIKTLRLPGDTTNEYQINAVALAGADGATVLSRIEQLEDQIGNIQGFDALTYKGTITPLETSPGAFTPAANKGDVYKVTNKGYIMSASVEVGDMLICNADNTPKATADNWMSLLDSWDIIQGNVDTEALLDHSHSADVSVVSQEFDVPHYVTPSYATLDFTNGTAVVSGSHSHTGSASIKVVPEGTINDYTYTPSGTITLSQKDDASSGAAIKIDASTTTAGEQDTNYLTNIIIDDHAAHTHTASTRSTAVDVQGSITINAGQQTANTYTPAGSITGTLVLDGVSQDISAHEVTKVSKETPAVSGNVSLASQGIDGTVSVDSHVVTSEPTSYNMPYALTGLYEGSGNDGILTLGLATTPITVYSEITIQDHTATFSCPDHTHTGTFRGTVAEHSHVVEIADHAPIVPQVTCDDVSTLKFAGVQETLTAAHALTATHEHSFTTDNGGAVAHVITPIASSHTHKIDKTIYVAAEFKGNSNTHNHVFSGAEQTYTGTITATDENVTLNGTATGSIQLNTATSSSNNTVITDVAIEEHTINGITSTGTLTTGKGTLITPVEPAPEEETTI